MKPAELETVAEVLDALGGNSAAARRLGESRQVVGNWRARGAIPAEQFLNVTSLLDEIGYAACSKIFNMKELA